jgi:hypothetical protein
MDDAFNALLAQMQESLNTINQMKGLPSHAQVQMDVRALHVAATYLETAKLWVANARRVE